MTFLSDSQASTGLIGLAERGLLPDALVRWGIREQCRRRLREELAGGDAAVRDRQNRYRSAMEQGAIAIETDAANRQHYELPPDFFSHCLGPQMKYSCAYFAQGDESIAEAEEAMLALTAERAELADGQWILELGCGWGSLTLWMATRFPNSSIIAVSNSATQREFIAQRCRERGLRNVQVLTSDVNELDINSVQFDRCVSVEMFEHLRNHDALMSRISGWLKPDGKLFVHVFCHAHLLYPFETEGRSNWMGRHFFTGGIMPAADTLPRCQEHFLLEQQWTVPGRHYQRTANLWLRSQDLHRKEVMAALESAYGAQAELWWHRWRLFWMACAELFGYEDGAQWFVSHYRFARR